MRCVRIYLAVVAAWVAPILAIAGTPVHPDVEYIASSLPDARAINRAFTDFAFNRAPLGDAYTSMANTVRGEATVPHVVTEFLDILRVVSGRYEDVTWPRMTLRNLSCETALPGASPLDSWLVSHAGSVRALLINEDHNDPLTRATIIALLPSLKKLGFTHLALEALPPSATADTFRRGFATDDASAGIYLRDPMAHLMLRRAVQIGFHLIGYDPQDADSAEEREAGEASAIASVLTNPDARIVVIAGHGHVSKDPAWLGGRLSRQFPGEVLTIDQTRGVGACAGSGGVGKAYALSDKAQAGLQGAMNVDTVVITPFTESGWRGARQDRQSWLTLSGLRTAVPVAAASLCPRTRTYCQIEAHRSGDVQPGVPEDRYVATDPHWHGWLFLTPGTYRITGTDESNHGTVSSLFVKK